MKTRHPIPVSLIVIAIVGLIAGHGAILYFFSTHLTGSVIGISSAAVLLMLKHLGLLGALYERLRGRPPRF